MAPKQAMYRPSFSLSELKELVSYIPQTSLMFKKMALYTAKAEMGFNPASYQISQVQTLEEQLGLAPASSTGRAADYSARLAKKAELAPATLTAEDRYNLLAGKAFAGEPLTEEELLEGQKLEAQLYQMDMGTFSPKEQPL